MKRPAKLTFDALSTSGLKDKSLKRLTFAGKPIKHSPYRSPDEKRMRKVIRALIKRFTHLEIKEDELVRELYMLVEDERRRCYMSMAPAGVQAMAAFHEIKRLLP